LFDKGEEIFSREGGSAVDSDLSNGSSVNFGEARMISNHHSPLLSQNYDDRQHPRMSIYQLQTVPSLLERTYGTGQQEHSERETKKKYGLTC